MFNSRLPTIASRWRAPTADGGRSIHRSRPGADYAFVVDGAEPPLPDPRSQSQPYGVHGRSRIVDHSAFNWTDARWNAPPLESAIVYELHVGTFTSAGTFDARSIGSAI